MRISGIYLLVFFIVHVIHAASILDRMTWGQMLFLTYSPMGFVVLSVMIALGTFHAINGIRLMFQQGGLGIGTPARPDYPCLLYTSPSPRDMRRSRMPSSA